MFIYTNTTGIYDAAGDAIAAVARRIGHLVIGACMDDQSAAITIEQGDGAGRQREPVRGRIQMALAITTDFQFRQIAPVRTRRVIKAVLFMQRVEVAARCGKRRAAVSFFVYMDTMRAGREATGLYIDMYRATAVLSEVCHPDHAAIYVPEHREGIAADARKSGRAVRQDKYR